MLLPKTLAFLGFASILGFTFLPLAQADVLKGGVQEDVNGHRTPTLNRSDIRPSKSADPFAGEDEGQELDPNPGAFSVDKPVVPPKPQRPLRGNVQDEGSAPPRYQQAMPRSAPQDLGGEEDPTPIRTMTPQQMPQRQYDPNDPDSSPEMQLAWDEWHKRVAGAIYDRYAFISKAAFKHSAPLLAIVNYTVTRDGHITNINVTTRSTNLLYNIICFQCIKSLDGDLSILQFPPNSRRMFVPKAGTFTQNYGGQQGFRYTTNDRETIHR